MSSDPAAGAAGAADPATVHTLAELAEAFQRLRGSRSYADLDKAINPNRTGNGPRVLPPATLNNLLHGKSMPRRETVEAFLTACGLDAAPQQPWLVAWERVATAHLRRPAGAVRVRQARPRLLGVHAAIQLGPGGDPDDLPPFVPRDIDAELRTAITAAADRGGFLLLVGGSSVGKTRALYETVLAALPEWWLVHPPDADAVRHLAAEPSPRTVVWLDELQRYLDGPGGIPAAAARALIAEGAAVVATIWPTEYRVRAADPQPGQRDQYSNDRELLRLAHVLPVAEDFSPAERRRAGALAADRRIRAAFDTPDAGFTQILAAGPDLVRHWENAPAEQCYGQAVITAALDARRVGATAPLSREFLKAATPGYLTGRQQADAPTDWLDKALAYATSPLRGATAALCPTSAGMGKVAGYTPADYLHQHALRTRRTTPLPDTAWQALVDYHHHDDTLRLADNAARRGRQRHAITLFGRAVDAWDDPAAYNSAAYSLAGLLAGTGCIDELRQRADAGNVAAAGTLAGLLAEQDCVDELRARADAGERWAHGYLIRLLAKQDRTEELRQRADAGDMYAQEILAELLSEQGCHEELRERADSGDHYASKSIIKLLLAQGNNTALLQMASAGNSEAVWALPRAAADEEDMSDAICLLRPRATSGDIAANWALLALLSRRGDVDELRRLLEAGHEDALRFVVSALFEQGKIDEALTVLQPWIEAENLGARRLRFELLVESGRIDEAAALIQSDNQAYSESCIHKLADLLIERGSMDNALTVLQILVDVGYENGESAARRIATLLLECDRIDELRHQADRPNSDAARLLAQKLKLDGNMEELRSRTNAGDWYSADALARLLAACGNVRELRDRSDSGNQSAAWELVQLLVERGDIEELESEVAAGTPGALDGLRLAGVGGDNSK